MDKRKKLLGDTIIYAIASFGSKFISFLLIPLYTGYFTSTEYGKWDLISTTISLVIPFISMELLSAVYRWLLEENDEEKQKEIISTGFIYTIKNLILFSAISLIFVLIFNISYGVLIIVMINLNIISDFIQKCLRGCGFNKEFASIGILQTIVTILTNLILIFVFKMRMEIFFIASILSNLGSIILGWYKLKFHRYIYSGKYSKTLKKDFFKYAFPMIPGAINWWIMNVSDRYIISLVMGIATNGIYAVANKLPSIVNMFNTVFKLAWQDNAILGYKDCERDKYYTEIFKYYFRFMMTSIIVLISANRIIMSILVKGNFKDAWRYTNLLYVAALISAFASFWGAGYHGAKKTGIILKTTFLGAIANIVINLIFIKKFGLFAAAISTIIAYLVMWLMRIFNKDKPFNIKIYIKDVIILGSILIIVLIMALKANIYIDMILIILSLFIFGGYNKYIVNVFIKSITKKKVYKISKSVNN